MIRSADLDWIELAAGDFRMRLDNEGHIEILTLHVYGSIYNFYIISNLNKS